MPPKIEIGAIVKVTKTDDEWKKLLSPAEMGELFKVIGMGKKNAPCPSAFLFGDQRHRL